jgi:hypothetical protein
MKRLMLLSLAVAFALPTAAHAQLIMTMSNGWSLAFSGNVNAFWVYTKEDSNGTAASKSSNSSIRTGLLPAFANFEARGKEAGLNLAVHFGFAPQINNAGVHDQFGAQIDMREVYLTVGGPWGQILAGRELALFSRQNILNDMTLFGVGAVGIRAGPGTGAQGGGTTLGRIGYGYLYPNFVAQATYSSAAGRPAQFSVGLFQPSIFGQSGTNAASVGYTYTTIPRLEAEVTYNMKSGANKFLLWAGGLWQNTSNAPSGGKSVSSIGLTAGLRANISSLAIVVSAYTGSGLGNVLMFSGQEVAPDSTDLRKSDGGYVQAMYTLSKKTNIGVSYGLSRLKNASAGETAGTGGNSAVRTQWTAVTAGLYHQWTKSVKLVAEATREQEGVGKGQPSQFDLSAGIMMFF